MSCVSLHGYVGKEVCFVAATLKWRICSKEALIGSARLRSGRLPLRHNHELTKGELGLLLHSSGFKKYGVSFLKSGRYRDVIQQHAPEAKRFIHAKAYRHRPLSEAERTCNRTKSKVRATVEHVCLVIKRIFGWATVRYRGLAKDTKALRHLRVDEFVPGETTPVGGDVGDVSLTDGTGPSDGE